MRPIEIRIAVRLLAYIARINTTTIEISIYTEKAVVRFLIKPP